MKINTRKLSYIFFLIVFFVALNYIFPNLIPNIYRAVFTPFYRISFGLSEGDLSSRNSLLSQLEKLKYENEELKSKSNDSTIKSLEIENLELRKYLVSTTTRVQNRKLYSVLIRPGLVSHDIMIVDIGLDDKIYSGDKVYGYNNIEIGFVSHIFSDKAQVILYSSDSIESQVYIGSSNIVATAEGRGGGQFFVDLPKGSSVNIGDTVSTSKLSNSLLGVVKSVIDDPSSPFIRVIITYPFNIYSLRWVQI
jgi:cell shape-determining protein MreC